MSGCISKILRLFCSITNITWCFSWHVHNYFFAAEKDASKGMGSGWERFEFNKDAPLDDEEVEG